MNTKALKKPELLAPAGNLEKLFIAEKYGADAVYIGGKDFSLRSYTENFSNPEIKEALEYLKMKNKKLYITLDNAALREELTYARTKLLKSLNKQVGESFVEEIFFK